MTTATIITKPKLTRPRAGIRLLPGIGITGQVSLWIIIAVALLAAVGPFFVHTDPNAVDLEYAYAPPSQWFPLGADASGRDILSRLVVGSRTALLGPLLVVTMATLLGVIVGLVAVWFGGWVDALVLRVIDAIFAFPGILVAILATALFGPGLPAATIALAIAYTPYIARIVRSAALRERNLPYISALRVQGRHGLPINLRHVLPNVSGLIIANATLCFGLALIDIAALSFIGFGVQPPTADWGAMVGSGMSGILQGEPGEALAASTLIVITVAAVNILGDRLVQRSENRS